jgi:hypothetical protein
MRKLVAAALSTLAFAAILAPSANANASPPLTRATSSKLSLTAKITSFRATASGVVAKGTLNGKLTSGTSVSRKSAPVSFAVAAASSGARCNVITLRLAPLNLELLGVQVTTSYISLDVYAVHGRVLGNLFCALAHAKVTLPSADRVARALNSHLAGRPLHVFAASESLPAAAAAAAQPQTCQVLKLVLGPLHLDLLGLVVDLYGKTHANPVIVTINAVPSQGLLGQLLCSVAGGSGINSLAGLQSLLSGLGVNLSTTQIQNLLNQLGITDLSSGLTQLDLNRILQALGLGQTLPTG